MLYEDWIAEAAGCFRLGDWKKGQKTAMSTFSCDKISGNSYGWYVLSDWKWVGKPKLNLNAFVNHGTDRQFFTYIHLY